MSVGVDPATGQIPPQTLGFGALFWVIRDAVVVGDAADGRIVLWNPAAERLFGYTAQQAVGKLLETLVPEELKPAHRDGLARFTSTGSGPLISAGIPVEVPALHKDGTRLMVELSLTPVPSVPQMPGQYVLALIRDATTRQRVAQEREAVLAAAQEYAARLEVVADEEAAFTAMVVRELSTPLASIRDLSDSIVRNDLSPEQRADVAHTISATAAVLSRLVTDVTTVSQLEDVDFAADRTKVAIEPLLSTASETGQLLSPRHRFAVTVDAALTGRAVEADADRIAEVLRILIGNAISFTPQGTQIALAAKQINDIVRISVADTGPGIAPEDLPRIFEKFGRGRNATHGKVPGLGLGLYVAREILAAHDSELSVLSTPGEGTTFMFDLPVR